MGRSMADLGKILKVNNILFVEHTFPLRIYISQYFYDYYYYYTRINEK